jgi:Fur family zinc uptake transcriptional regulator
MQYGREIYSCPHGFETLRTHGRSDAMTELFPPPNHNHDRCTADVLAHAESLCASRAQRLTPMRRKVLEVLAGSHRPLGAYDIIDSAAASGPRPAPITIYRALEFLIANGLVHRLESRNAFLACGHNHDSGALVAFLICESCGEVGEAPGGDVGSSLTAAAASAGFAPTMSVVEITGTCSRCREHTARTPARAD